MGMALICDLHSERAAQVSIAVTRAFVRLREMIGTHEDLARKVQKHDQQITSLYRHVEKLLRLPEPKKNPMGFIHPKDGKK